ncbi:MAG TPA: electron transport complex subunit RsxE, partial [Azonexus sp.]|nr:electron transport complex subunit RsxE [Azonexus sp.]
FAFLEVQVPGYGGALLMILPPGGFAVLGFMLAGKRIIDQKLAARAQAAATPATA